MLVRALCERSFTHGAFGKRPGTRAALSVGGHMLEPR